MSFDSGGKIVVFLGPDGAGKSTILELLKAEFQIRDYDYTSRYFAPGFLRRYRGKEGGAITTAPHEGRQYGPILILAKLCLMLFEFHMGVPRLRQSYRIVLFDRYLHDVLIDPRRYRMERQRWWMRLILKAAPKPDLLVVISAPVEVIQARKQEVPPEETARQVAAYQSLAELMPGSIVVSNTSTVEVAAEQVMAKVESLL